ncbi:S8 family serine peptidase [uncultured Psychroserpens sp.]|uniref:S8 family serine peptidase n=1 Tax=uncultured Psychroserpens sp. TaxID=255436 RepID=UPI0026321C85|nr:S8 family serine peptidase [uncultured Psychroserpens sp.]
MLKQSHTKKYICLLLCLLSGFMYSQSEDDIENPKKSYYVVMISEFQAPEFKAQNGVLRYSGDNSKEKEVFDRYEILKFYQVYSRFKSSSLRSAFYLETTSEDLPSILLKNFPIKYKAIEDITDHKIELLSQDPYYPEEFTTSSVRIPFDANTFDRSGLEYINAPRAWGITNELDPGTVIGISDAKIDDTDSEFDEGKVEFVGYYPFANTTPDCEDPSAESTHGTGVAAIAAAKGDNGYGSIGVCYDCNILATSYKPDVNTGPQFSELNGVLALAQHGARVINMSWGLKTSLNPDEYRATYYGSNFQEAINEIVDGYDVVLVAAAGNRNSFEIWSGNSLIGHSNTPVHYEYPASLDNVISVSSVNHWYTLNEYPDTEFDTEFELNGDKYYRFMEDAVSPYVKDPENVDESPYGIYINPWHPEVGFPMHTLNESIDILAPGYQVFGYPKIIYDCVGDLDPDENPIHQSGKYGSGTSAAAPFVTGTIGLMYTVDQCLTSKEVEAILKLTAKDVESNPINSPFIGHIGAGKLETGNAVEFVNEMNKSDGDVKIKNHIFYRYNFDISRFENDLSLENVEFIEDAKVTFKAKNIIDLSGEVTLEPNINGFIDLGIDNDIENRCNYMPPIPPDPDPIDPVDPGHGNDEPTDEDVMLSPNPARDYFIVELNYDDDQVSQVLIYNSLGVQIMDVALDGQQEINVSSLNSGIYSVKIFTFQGYVFSKQLIKY